MKALEIKIGDFVEGKYRFGAASGRVKKILKNHVIISEHSQWYNTYTDLNKDLKISKESIYAINNPDNIYN